MYHDGVNSKHPPQQRQKMRRVIVNGRKRYAVLPLGFVSKARGMQNATTCFQLHKAFRFLGAYPQRDLAPRAPSPKGDFCSLTLRGLTGAKLPLCQ
mmetsp:Transcript_68629/g.110640  ORF Transcript_68629/g.110640 Transcript_68629/m.110640 type:complete len:96 (+) Transcript_68629:591-878(+)